MKKIYIITIFTLIILTVLFMTQRKEKIAIYMGTVLSSQGDTLNNVTIEIFENGRPYSDKLISNLNSKDSNLFIANEKSIINYCRTFTDSNGNFKKAIDEKYRLIPPKLELRFTKNNFDTFVIPVRWTATENLIVKLNRKTN